MKLYVCRLHHSLLSVINFNSEFIKRTQLNNNVHCAIKTKSQELEELILIAFITFEF